jgi:O-antigen/teichoic acid export membrane protein
LNIQGIRIVVGLVMGPAAVAAFVPIRTLSQFAMQPRTMINRVIQPEMALAFGGEDTDLFRRLFNRSCQLALWGSVTAVVFLAVAGGGLFPLWTAGQVTMNWPLYLLLLGTALINAVWHTALMAMYATNRVGKPALAYIAIYGALAFALAYAGIHLFGFIGVGAALLVVELIMAVYVVPASLRFTGESGAAWAGTIVRPPTFLLRGGLSAVRRA